PCETHRPDHDAIKWNRIMISSPCLSMIFSENLFPLFRIMLYRNCRDAFRSRHRLSSFGGRSRSTHPTRLMPTDTKARSALSADPDHLSRLRGGRRTRRARRVGASLCDGRISKRTPPPQPRERALLASDPRAGGGGGAAALSTY